MTFDADKLRALDEAAAEAWTEYLTLGTPHPSVTLETRLRHAFMTGFCTARSQSDPAILAMAEREKRMREQYSDPPKDRRFLAKVVTNGFNDAREWGPTGRAWVEAHWIEERQFWAAWNGDGHTRNDLRIEIMAWAELPFDGESRALGEAKV